MLQWCVSVCYIVCVCVGLCVTVCYSVCVLQCFFVLQCVCLCFFVLQCVTVCVSVLQCVLFVLQCVCPACSRAPCEPLQFLSLSGRSSSSFSFFSRVSHAPFTSTHARTCCSELCVYTELPRLTRAQSAARTRACVEPSGRWARGSASGPGGSARRTRFCGSSVQRRTGTVSHVRAREANSSEHKANSGPSHSAASHRKLTANLSCGCSSLRVRCSSLGVRSAAASDTRRTRSFGVNSRFWLFSGNYAGNNNMTINK